ncbi:hypothetical protein GCM10010326_31990 [Streptomyces xanthochromogenes]|uniref:Uncharacterized protein n=1 Tax=Streptomyces xanthochromogenes TaxID=67384 RepID=A0ABQ3A7W6_9ACTN|nr:hypothetical protein GCM10010326_31990 [Streptomyces xanthochromogenes]
MRDGQFPCCLDEFGQAVLAPAPRVAGVLDLFDQVHGPFEAPYVVRGRTRAPRPLDELVEPVLRCVLGQELKDREQTRFRAPCFR